MWRDHGRTESPNAGWTMSGMAGALGVALEKVGHYRLGDATRRNASHKPSGGPRGLMLAEKSSTSSGFNPRARRSAGRIPP